MKRLSMVAALALVAFACSGGETTPDPTPDTKPPAADGGEKTPAQPDKTFSADQLKAEAEQVALVPSPAEMQKTLSNSGLESSLSSMVADRDITMDVDNKDQIAVRTGVVLADLVLTIKDSPKEKVVQRLGRLKQGLAKLGAGDDVQKTIDDIEARVSTDAVSRDDLLKEMDELSGVMVPELEYEAGEWVVPLIQAGSWLEGANLVSGAIKKEGKYDAAGTMLQQPAVVDYFLAYVQREGKEKAPDEVVARLEETLKTLKEVTSKDTLTEEDVGTIHTSTTAVLSML